MEAKGTNNTISNTSKKTLYTAIGDLFYAIAAADLRIPPEEHDTLIHLISTEWYLDGKDADDIIHIVIKFEELATAHESAGAAMERFKKFKTANEKLFTDDVVKRIWTTVNSLAEAVAGKNKSELVMLAQLSSILKQSNV